MNNKNSQDKGNWSLPQGHTKVAFCPAKNMVLEYFPTKMVNVMKGYIVTIQNRAKEYWKTRNKKWYIKDCGKTICPMEKDL